MFQSPQTVFCEVTGMLHGETKIKLLSGNVLTLNEMNQSKENFFVYSIDEQGDFYPAQVLSINKSYSFDTFVTKLDCGSCIETSQDHLFIKKELELVSANLLKKGDSLFPMHFQINKEEYNYDREMYYDYNLNKYMFTHHRVMSYMEPKIDVGGFDIHHIDENHFNNNPTNLMWVDSNMHKTFHERERANKYNAERDKNFQNDQKRNSILASAACLIRKYFILDKDLLESKKILGFLKYPINLFLVDKYFETFDEFLNLSYEYEKHLTNSDYERLTRSADERKASKRNAMAKIGRLLLDEGKQITEDTYQEKMRQLHIKAQPFSKIEKYFKTFENYMTHVKNYNHKVMSTQIMKYEEKQSMYHIKLKNSSNLCIFLEKNNYLIIHT